MKFFSTMAMLPVLALGGCLFSQAPYQETRYYDLPPAPVRDGALRVETVSNATAARQRMLYRAADSQVVIDEYHRWIQSPDQMLARYLAASFPRIERTNGAPEPVLRATLLNFDIDPPRRQLTLTVDYELREGGRIKTGNFSCSEPFKTPEPAEFADAAGRAAVRLAAALEKVLRESKL